MGFWHELATCLKDVSTFEQYRTIQSDACDEVVENEPSDDGKLHAMRQHCKYIVISLMSQQRTRRKCGMREQSRGLYYKFAQFHINGIIKERTASVVPFQNLFKPFWNSQGIKKWSWHHLGMFDNGHRWNFDIYISVIAKWPLSWMAKWQIWRELKYRHGRWLRWHIMREQFLFCFDEDLVWFLQYNTSQNTIVGNYLLVSNCKMMLLVASIPIIFWTYQSKTDYDS